MKRRGFVKLCAGAVAGIAASPEIIAAGKQQYQRYGRVALVDAHTRNPVSASALEVGETYLFHYPYISTPCFLIDLGHAVEAGEELRTRDGEPYRWQGGSGPRRSLVAFSAICAHKMSHPTPSVSFIGYRHGETRFRNNDNSVEERSGVIYCCSENSVYDPASGARVLGGPAPQPLAAIELEYDANSDQLYATGTLGGEMFDRYFENFHDRLMLQLGGAEVDSQPDGHTELMRLSDYTGNQVSCEA